MARAIVPWFIVAAYHGTTEKYWVQMEPISQTFLYWTEWRRAAERLEDRSEGEKKNDSFEAEEVNDEDGIELN
jgi:hypothetical protein